jgi:hypothetical protein
MAIDTCFELPRFPTTLPKVQLLGGVEISGLNIIGQLQPALAPLVPLFNILDAVLAVIEVLKAVASLNPVTIANALIDAAEKFAKLLRLIPQLSIPFMILDIIDALIYELTRLRNQLVRLQTEVESIDAARDRAELVGNPAILLTAISCADGNIQIELDNQLTTMQVLQRVFAVMEILLELIGLGGAIPDLGDLSGAPLSEAVEIVDDIIAALQALRDQIPF